MARQEFAPLEQFSAGVHGASSTEAFIVLGIQYSTGRGVEPDLVEAHKWFNIAAARGNRSAAAYRREIAREMTAMEIREAQRQAREWVRMN